MLFPCLPSLLMPPHVKILSNVIKSATLLTKSANINPVRDSGSGEHTGRRQDPGGGLHRGRCHPENPVKQAKAR